MARLALVLALVALGAGLAVTGCEEDATTEPTRTTGQIEGKITALGIPVEASVIAHCIVDDSGHSCSCPNLLASTDSSGAYQIVAPVGRYVLLVSVRSSACCVSGMMAHGTLARTEADTLDVDGRGSPVRADLNLGAARIELTVPSAPEGLTMRAVLVAQNERPGLQIRATAHASEGFAAFYFPAVPSGLYKMRLESANTEFWLPGSYAEGEGALLDVGREAETIYQSDASGLATLRGTIIGSWQELNLNSPAIRMFGPDSTEVVRGYADLDGAFAFMALAPIRARLLIDIEGVRRWQGGGSYAEATVFELTPGEDRVVNIVESGIVGELGQETPSCPNVSITLYDETGKVLGRSGARGSTGMFFFPNLVLGTYRIGFADGPTWIEHYYNLSDSLESATPIVVASVGQVVWVYPELMPGATISGIVLDQDDEPVAGSSIFLTADDDPDIFYNRQTLTRAGGAFDLMAIADGSYKVGAYRRNGGEIWYPGTASWDSASVVTIANHENLTGLVIRSPR